MFTNMYYYALRIVSYLSIALLLAMNMNRVKGFREVALMLGYILVCQLSMYLLKRRNQHKNRIEAGLFFLCTILELGFIIILSQVVGITMYFLIFILILDVVMFYKKSTSLIWTGGIVILSSYYLHIHSDSQQDMVLFYLGSAIVVIVVSLYLHILEGKKNQAQDFYDQLRITEGELVKAYGELESYSKTIEELTLLRERTRVSRELHDSVGHALSTLCIQLKAVKTITEKKPQLAADMLENNVKYVENALENVRRTVRELKPIEFESLDAIFTIEEMIKSFSKLTGVEVKLILSKDKWTMTSDQSHHLYRIIQESMSNALRHGKAKHITVNIQFLQDKLYTYIKDDGIGCKMVNPSFGLKGIRERAHSLGGTVEYSTGEGEGFATKLTLPKDKIVVHNTQDKK